MPKTSDLSIFKSYDVRGVYPAQLDESVAYEIGRLFVNVVGAEAVAVGFDMRASSKNIFEALVRGITDSGADVIDVGMVSTDALYFAVGKFGYDGGIMITASHNPGEYNGMKFTRKSAQAISLETGLSQIRDIIAVGEIPKKASVIGTTRKLEILDDFARHCLTFIDAGQIKPLKIAVDAGNGMGGQVVSRVFKNLPCQILPMYFEPDGTFPNHPANPLEPANMLELQQVVRQERCDLGVAFDGDADRMFIVDEKGNLIGGDIVTALVAMNILRHTPSARILYNVICSRSVKEVVEKHGGTTWRSPVGHSLIKKIMRDNDIVFGGEHSGHFYFKDNWYADSGMIALLQCLEVFSQSGKPVSETIAPIDHRHRSGEINSRVDDIPGKLNEIQERFGDAEIDYLDGLTISYPGWWMNVRASNTEPFLRLNLEAESLSLMEEKKDEVLAIIRN